MSLRLKHLGQVRTPDSEEPCIPWDLTKGSPLRLGLRPNAKQPHCKYHLQTITPTWHPSLPSPANTPFLASSALWHLHLCPFLWDTVSMTTVLGCCQGLSLFLNNGVAWRLLQAVLRCHPSLLLGLGYSLWCFNKWSPKHAQVCALQGSGHLPFPENLLAAEGLKR